ncbi:helix-turn-helix domain-containing protein [Deminuibacter soli]|uniref:DNA-binding protein n=1 Tax=Deminuibacter soli TaxID=2291815 RepID=A0A3E1NQ71_9BACT|nr:helix-turn-helix domain-containing protein [Deminuibacter soli]RFM30075.1 DNA-binding protein [Deminuibacter soli]
MQSGNPFEVIIERLDQLQITVNLLSSHAEKVQAGPASDPNRLIDLTEAANIVCRPIGTVRHYIHHRNLPAIKVGKSYLVKYSELLDWVQKFNDPQLLKKSAISPMLSIRKRYGK